MAKKEPCINDDAQPSAAILELQSYIEAVEKDAVILEDKNFAKRVEIIDFLDFPVIGRIEELLKKTAYPRKLGSLKQRPEKIITQLEDINARLFQTLQVTLRAKRYSAATFKNLVNKYINFSAIHNGRCEEPGYDNLDIFINALFSFRLMPEQTIELEPEMVFYQKTPARIVFELVEISHFTPEDVFFDIGAGLGQAAILVGLLSGITVTGIEFQPTFCKYATDCANMFNLSNVTFINIDARQADYSCGTVFFMFTPFKGEMLQQVLDILRTQSLLRKIKVITYGPCTAAIALQSWLQGAAPEDGNMYKLAVFSSL